MRVRLELKSDLVVCGEERVMYVCDGCTMMELGRGCLDASAFGSGVACQRVLGGV